MKGVWKRSQGGWQNGEEFWLGSICVGNVLDNPLRTKGDPLVYQAALLLPGIRLKQVNYAEIEEGKAAVEAAVSAWLRKIGQ
jgi:hypothetical protein